LGEKNVATLKLNPHPKMKKAQTCFDEEDAENKEKGEEEEEKGKGEERKEGQCVYQEILTPFH